MYVYFVSAWHWMIFSLVRYGQRNENRIIIQNRTRFCRTDLSSTYFNGWPWAIENWDDFFHSFKAALSAFISFLFLHFYESTLQCSQCVAESVTKTKPTWERNNKWQSQEKNKQSKKISNFFNCKQSKWSMLQPRISSFSFFLRKRNKRKEIERAAHK